MDAAFRRRSSSSLSRAASCATAQVSGAMRAPSAAPPSCPALWPVPATAIGTAATMLASGSQRSNAGRGSDRGGLA